MGISEQNDADTIPMDRVPLDSITVYEVTERELEDLANGGRNGLLLNFAICFFSVAATILATALATDFSDPNREVLFMVFGFVSLGLSIALALQWFVGRKPIKDTASSIRARRKVSGAKDKETNDPQAVNKLDT